MKEPLLDEPARLKLLEDMCGTFEKAEFWRCSRTMHCLAAGPARTCPRERLLPGSAADTLRAVVRHALEPSEFFNAGAVRHFGVALDFLLFPTELTLAEREAIWGEGPSPGSSRAHVAIEVAAAVVHALDPGPMAPAAADFAARVLAFGEFLTSELWQGAAVAEREARRPELSAAERAAFGRMRAAFVAAGNERQRAAVEAYCDAVARTYGDAVAGAPARPPARVRRRVAAKEKE